jgi:IrrE N-terminal-like domain
MSIETLRDGVAEVFKSNTWSRYQAFNNAIPQFEQSDIIRIVAMMPNATQMGPESFWNRFGRQVIEGSCSIVVDGEEQYDIAQTVGKSIPLPVELLKGKAPQGSFTMLANVARERGFRVLSSKTAMPNGVHGETRQLSRKVIINANNTPKHKIKTLAHELGHVYLHLDEYNRTKAEIEAESVAHLVCEAMGIDTMPYSAGYLATWANDEWTLDEHLSNSVIIKTADKILDRLTTP